MNHTPYLCKRCNGVLPETSVNSGRFGPCPFCGHALMVRRFPAATMAAPDAVGATIPRADEQAGCFFHPGRVADSLCERCGRFVCSLCAVEFKGQDHCPTCMRQRLDPESAPDAARRLVRHDKIALLLALLPIFAWPFTIVTGPAALLWGVRSWNKPGSLVESGRVRMAFAILLGALQTTGWIVFLFTVLNRRLR